MTDIHDVVEKNDLVRLKNFCENEKFLFKGLCNLAAKKGHIDCLKYLHKNGYPWNNWTCNYAAMNGNIECLKYAHENRCSWDEDTCFYAAENGHLECLKYAHENGCPWDEDTCSHAAENGHLECLKYAHENGCPWSADTCKDAARNDHIECVKYAYENGCPCHKKFISTIVQKILIPKWRAAVKSRQIIIYWMERSAQTSCAENGRARIEDINSFENDFNNLIL